MWDHQIKCPECGFDKYFFDNDVLNFICSEFNHEFERKIKPLRIFLSYGRDDHSAVAWKLKDDLQKKGHQVWFDNERLKTGEVWENYIEKGLDWISEDPSIGRVVLVMTPHSVRRENPDIPDSDDGYCLNEIHRALQKKVDVIPVMLVWCEPPLSICRVQWLDMMDCLPPKENESTYAEKFDLLLAALEEGEVKHGFQTSLKTLLEPLEFDVEILKHVERFMGRKWVFDAIDEWIKNPKKSRIFWIVGGPGTGKTAIASWLCEKRRKAAAFHLCQHNDTIKSDPRRCLMSISYQLSTQIPDYYEQLKTLELKNLVNEMNVSTLFREIIAKPLSKIPEPEEVPLIILIDALDEATKDRKNELADFVSRYFHQNPEETPEWLRVIITSRCVSEVKGPLQGIKPYILDTELQENLNDINKYLNLELEPYFPEGQVDQRVLRIIIEKSEGNFLYVEWIRRELENGNITIENVKQFPQGLGSIYFDFFNREFPDIDFYEEKIAPALDIISAAQEPLELDFISFVMGWTDREKHKFQRKTDSLFVTKDEKIEPFHKSLMDWLTNTGGSGDYYISEADGHRKLAQIGWDNYKNGINHLSPYMLNYLPDHLIKSGLWEEIHELLTNLYYIEKKCASGMTYKLIDDYKKTLDFIPEAQKEKKEKIERMERLKEYTEDLISFAQGKTKNLKIIPSVELLADERINEDLDRIISNPTRLDRINAFSKFVNSQSHSLNEFGYLSGFCVQQAYNSADSGPVVETAKKVINEDLNRNMALRGDKGRSIYNPNPILLKTLEGHEGGVEAVVITPDGKIAVSGSSDTNVFVWDLETGKVIKTLKGHTRSVKAVAITPDGKIAISGSDDGSVRCWDIEKDKSNKFEGHTNMVETVDITPDGKIAVSGSDDNSVRIWDIKSGKLLKILKGHTDWVWSVAITPDGGKAISGSRDNTVRLWDLETGGLLKILKGHSDMVYSVAITPDNKKAITAGRDKIVCVWDLEVGKLLKTLKGHTNWIWSVAITPDGGKAISGSRDNTVRLWDLETGKLLKILKGHTDWVWSVAITPDGGKAISGSGDQTINLWDLETGRSGKLEEQSNMVYSVALTPDNKKAITSSRDNTVQLLNLNNNKILKKLDGLTYYVKAVNITPNGQNAILGSSDQQLYLWNLKNGRLNKLKGHQRSLGAINFSPDFKTVITGSYDGSVRIWDLENGVVLKTFRGHEDYVRTVTFSPDGNRAISGGDDRTLRVWELKTGKQIKKMETDKSYIWKVIVTPDGRKAISGNSDGTIQVWDLETFNLIKTLNNHKEGTKAIAVTPDCKKLITGSYDRTLRIWDLENWEIICVSKEESMIVYLAMQSSFKFVFGTSTGEIIFSNLINIPVSKPLTTAKRIWINVEKDISSNYWNEDITADCNWCGKRFKVVEEMLDNIREIKDKYNKSNGWILDEAWEDPRLVSECPFCSKKIRFNPFIVDNKS